MSERVWLQPVTDCDPKPHELRANVTRFPRHVRPRGHNRTYNRKGETYSHGQRNSEPSIHTAPLFWYGPRLVDWKAASANIAISSSDHTWSDMPAAIAGVIRRVLWTLAKL